MRKFNIYEAFDNEILENIKNGSVWNWQLCRNSRENINTNTVTERYRAVDRRLQVLRKKGLIKYDYKKGWQLNES